MLIYILTILISCILEIFTYHCCRVFPLALHHRLLIHILKMNTWVIFNLFYFTFEFDLEWELELCQAALIRRR